MDNIDTIENHLHKIYKNYACQALLGGVKSTHIMLDIKEIDRPLFESLITKAKEELIRNGVDNISVEKNYEWLKNG